MDWPLALIAFVVFVVVLGIVQWHYVRMGQPTISARIQGAFREVPVLGLFVGLVVGLVLGHWFWP